MPAEDDTGHVLRATLPRPTWMLGRWSKLLLAVALLQPIWVTVWALGTYVDDDQPQADYRQVTLDLDAARSRLNTTENALLQDRMLMRKEMGLLDPPSDVVHAVASVREKWGEPPYVTEDLELAAWCMSGETDPSVVRCERDGEWITGAEATFMLYGQFGSLRRIEGSRRNEITELLRRREADYWAAKTDFESTQERQHLATLRADEVFAARGTWASTLLMNGSAAVGLMCLFVGLAFLGGVSRPAVRIEVLQNGVRIDGEWISASDIVGCLVEGDRLTIRLLGGDRRSFGPVASPAYALEDLAAAIVKIGLTPDERMAEARARVDILAQQSALKDRLPDPGG